MFANVMIGLIPVNTSGPGLEDNTRKPLRHNVNYSLTQNNLGEGLQVNQEIKAHRDKTR